MSIIDTLITDRTQADVKAQNEKGTYNASDLNRVESAVDYLAVLLASDLPIDLHAYAESLGVAWDSFFDVPYDPGDYKGLSIKTDWAEEDVPTASQMSRYLGNVSLLRAALDYETADLPGSMQRLTWSGANAIEEALVNLDAAITELEARTKQDMDNTASNLDLGWALGISYIGLYAGGGL